MSRGIHYQYYVEGECEKALIEALKIQQAVIPGKVNVFNTAQNILNQTHIRLLASNTTTILIVDTDTNNPKPLKENIRILKTNRNIREVWCVFQVKNLEDELKRATDIRNIKELLGCKSNKDFKTAFITERHLLEKLNNHAFKYDLLWTTIPPITYAGIENAGYKIKKI